MSSVHGMNEFEGPSNAGTGAAGLARSPSKSKLAELTLAQRREQGDFLEALLQYNQSPSASLATLDAWYRTCGSIHAHRRDAWPPLLVAVHRGDVLAIQYLLERGADVQRSDDYGLTALHVAAARGFGDCAIMLLERGANPNARTTRPVDCFFPLTVATGLKDSSGRTPLHLAAARGHREVIVMLLRYDVLLHEKDAAGCSALDAARAFASAAGPEAVADLLERAPSEATDGHPLDEAHGMSLIERN